MCFFFVHYRVGVFLQEWSWFINEKSACSVEIFFFRIFVEYPNYFPQ